MNLCFGDSSAFARFGAPERRRSDVDSRVASRFSIAASRPKPARIERQPDFFHELVHFWRFCRKDRQKFISMAPEI